ncbi:Nucleoporin [Wickerhamomyces ciferrii]|uniref:mRNA export factor GLE1 n=1 Tax=Wickerhamomyces ciferrii (strain ATCC 14091 / BCRC 22168 / CBS 111 / JCM 3599 / NBRC 0793 / NRRL Y-1031 F-60-10) TaxID=1206466 RepID=K0KHI9_WICCF|nr:Nucleoporin [Wickerhamomyces ciferrii]CCH42481.1 Nucleoporin [Wickerhamomyces ciferrii]
MRFSPHRTISNTSREQIDPGYDSLSDDEYTDEGPLGLIDSSPLKSVLTPSKSISSSHLGKKGLRKTYQVFNSSPLASKADNDYIEKSKSKQHLQVHDLDSEFEEEEEIESESESDDNNGNADISESFDELSELLKDLKFKERYELVQQSKQYSSRINSRSTSRISSRPSSARHTRRPSLHELGTDPSSPSNDQSGNSSRPSTRESYIQKIQESIINDVETRASTRSREVTSQLEAIELERKRLEEERKRREEEERRRAEEERKRKEEEERQRKAEEERQRIEAEKKAKEEAERLARERKEKEEREAKEAKKKAEDEAKRQKEQEEQDAKKGKGITNYKEVEKQFFHYKKLIETIKSDIVLKVKNDLGTKNAVLKHKRKINPKFGQLTNSMTQLSRISNEVITLINETKSNELAYKWILNFVAKAIVAQAETEVRVQPTSSLPLAKLTLNLLVEFPELKELLMARFVKKCPLVIGYTCNVDTEEGRLRMGWKRHDGSKWEDEISYDERLGGIMTLYAVLTKIPLDSKYFNNLEHPFDISNSWILLARIINLPSHLLLNVHFIVISSWWEACANELIQIYGKQGEKLLNLIWTLWAQSVNDKNYSGAKTLQTIGEDWQTSGKLKTFEPMEA